MSAKIAFKSEEHVFQQRFQDKAGPHNVPNMVAKPARLG